jgi:hypothetical protein
MGHTSSALLAPGCNTDIALPTDLAVFIAIPFTWIRNHPHTIDGVCIIYVAVYLIAVKRFFYR